MAGLASTAALLGASVLSAQVVTNSTSGAFSGGTGETTCTATQCTVGGFTLSFVDAVSTNYLAPTLVDLGQFMVIFSPLRGSSVPIAFTGVDFTLTINQAAPSGGSSSFSGAISGSLAYNPSTSTLVWSPETVLAAIGPVAYRLVTDNTGSISIQAPAGIENPNPTSVKGTINVTPELGTFLLLAPGLAGLGIGARMRRGWRRNV